MAKKILLADDSITIQKVVELTFSDGDYEVTAVNNGAKAIQKLSEMRPDIILSDIIMPEKNGYEVCEFVKSHPEYRNIPVILLTGTFEPFDPDRADKAGCDAVVTKPFESQSLIHKVEELIHQSQSQPAPAAAEPEPEPPSAPALFADEPAFAPPPVEAAHDPFAHDNDIFASAPVPTPTQSVDMPFEPPQQEHAFGDETRSLPHTSFEEMQKMANEPEVPTAPQATMPVVETSPWDEPAAAFGGETRAFPRMSFEEMQKMAAGSPPAAASTPGPFDATPPPPPPAPEASPWDSPPEDSGATRAFPALSFEEMRSMAEKAQPTPSPFDAQAEAEAPSTEASPWDEPPAAFGGETRAFPRMSFEEMEKLAAKPAAAADPAWAPAEEKQADPFAEPAPSESPFAAAETPEPAPAAESSWSPEPAQSEAKESDLVNSQITDTAAAPGDLTDAQIDRIARRVVQLMSDQVIRNIAWEVIPDLAEMVVKERIKQLEAEA